MQQVTPKNGLFFILFSLFLTPLFSQQTGEVDLTDYGVKFTIPSGWVGQAMEDVYVIGHPSQPGMILLTANEATSMEQMRQEAKAGLNDPASGVYLQSVSELENIGKNGVGGLFEGTMQGQQVKSYMVGVLNPYGTGALVIGLGANTQWSDADKQRTIQVAKSIKFSKVEAPAVTGQGGSIEEWKNRLGNTKLTYMSSYSSLDYSNPNITTGGGYSDKEVIDLCKAGYFNYSSSSFTSITGGAGVSGNVIGQGKGNGAWDIRAESNGNKILVLKFYSGEVYEYTLSYPENKMHLNGKRFYHTWTGENAPSCF